MPTFRTPRGLALTLLGTLALLVLAIGISSARELVHGGARYDFASWLRSPALGAVALLMGLTFWALLAFLSYGFRVTGTRAAVAAGIVLIALASAFRATEWDLPVNDRYVSATWLGVQPPGLLGTHWKGIRLSCQGELADLTIDPTGRVVGRYWPAPDSWLIVLLVELRVTPPAAPYSQTGQLHGDLLFWDGGYVERIRRDGERLRFEHVPYADVTTGPLPTSE